MLTVSKRNFIIALFFLFFNTYDLFAANYSASFKNTDIQEFINTVSKNLNKTIIIDPSIKAMINVRSYDVLNEEQYYQFFLSVLDVYGFAVIPMPNGLLKVVKAVTAKTGAIPVKDELNTGVGDEVVTRIVPVHNVSVRELAPLLRQLNDNAGAGNVIHYEQSNVLLLTGRAAVINRLVEIVHRVDEAGSEQSDIIKLKYASASQMVRLVTALSRNDRGGAGSSLTPKIAADERTNSIVLSGEPRSRQRLITIIRQLDHEQPNLGNTRVFYLQHAQAKNLVSVLVGSSKTSTSEPTGGTKSSTELSSDGVLNFNGKDLSIVADEQTNALVITAPLNTMQEFESIIAKLDIRRAQVLVEAIIVEMQDSDALNFGVQWVNKQGGGTQFTGTGLPASSVVTALGSSSSLSSDAASALTGFNGIAAGFYSGNWGGLVTALANNAKSNILATPSIVTLANKEAEINVGQEVPVITGSQANTVGGVYSTVERKTVGTKLKVTPQINEGDLVLLDIEHEVSSVVADSGGNSLGATFNTRTIKNSVLVKSGETVVLGGLLNNQTSESVYKVPILGDIPLLGYLFRYNSTSTSKQNLMVFIHPTILFDSGGYSAVSSEKYKLFQDEQQNQLNKRDPLVLPSESLTLPAIPNKALVSPGAMQQQRQIGLKTGGVK
ncbi:type II secretion system secretin GspD [Yersinia enterocolitica]|uniref:type II secretion system secretin GspD n=2 Tax=Yersinia enterocolitica TaxID=630 RepID=UPI0030B21402|nr:type II secretion system secretin GspD [Yersinia enterocolitica]EKN6081427.1 type II secretion system protein GspD [Yersinia enterocolitica]EKN6153987.1 type II secretion system protein GspD [Yersinia enterocolitica]